MECPPYPTTVPSPYARNRRARGRTVSSCQGTSQFVVCDFSNRVARNGIAMPLSHSLANLISRSVFARDNRIGHQVTGTGPAPYYPTSRKGFQDVAALMRR